MSFLAGELDELLREAGVSEDLIEARMPWSKPHRKKRERVRREESSFSTHYHHLGPSGRLRNVGQMGKEKLQHLSAHPDTTDELRQMVRRELRHRGHHVPRLRESAYIEAWGRGRAIEHTEFPQFSRVHHPYQPDLGGTVIGHRTANPRVGGGVKLHHVRWDRVPHGSEGDGKVMWEHPDDLRPHGASLHEAGIHPSRRGRTRKEGRPMMGVPATSGIYRHPQKGSFLLTRGRENPMSAGSIVGFRHNYDKEYGIKGYRLARVVRNEHKRSGMVAIREPGGGLHEIESKRITAVVPKHREHEAFDAVEKERGLHNIHAGFMGHGEKERRMRRPKPREDRAIVGDYVRRALGSEDREFAS
jgi:hypothetical protein